MSSRCVSLSSPTMPLELVEMACNGRQPSARSGHISMCDDDGANLYVFGGFHVDTCYADLFKLHLATKTWTPVRTSGTPPSRRCSHQGVLYGNTMLVFGGTGVPFGDQNTNDSYLCDLQTNVWYQIPAVGDIPSPRYGHSLARCGSKLYMFGGTSGQLFYNDLYSFDLDNFTWSIVHPQIGSGARRASSEESNRREGIPDVRDCPPPRYRHVAVFHEGTMYVIGGGKPHTLFNSPIQVYAFDTDTVRWRSIQFPKSKSTPIDRRSHTCVLHRDSIIMCGGTPGGVGKPMLNDLWLLDLISMKWTQIELSIPLQPKCFHSATMAPDGRMYIFGGYETSDGARRTNKVVTVVMEPPTLLWMCVRSFLSLNLDELDVDVPDYVERLGLPDSVRAMILCGQDADEGGSNQVQTTEIAAAS